MGLFPASENECEGVSQPERAASENPRLLDSDPVEPLVQELIPAPDPEDVFLRALALPHTVFFDSALRHPSLGRYSFLGADPFEWIWSRGQRTFVSGQPPIKAPPDPFATLSARLAMHTSRTLAGLPPLQGGAAGLFGYELCHHLERLPRVAIDEFQAPDLAVGLYDWAVSWDHVQDRAWLISTGLPESDPARRQRRARQRLRQAQQLLQSTPALALARRAAGPDNGHGLESVQPLKQAAISNHPRLISNFSHADYLAAARRAIEYVHAGDCFQVNLAQRLLFPVSVPAGELYLRLRRCNAAPFAAFFDLGEFQIASASPERFMLVEDGMVSTRPIKGTRPRGTTPAEDQAQAAELCASAKDRAENIMIVDLLRNDLGRVCRYGSVQVASLCNLETFRYVHHLVSEVRGRLRQGLGPIDLLRAAFPGGSVTGAPKIRAMEIIAELEETARGPYCGSLGYLGFDGNMDTNILIRTFTQGKGWVQFPVGGGIVADSSPEREYEETWHKAEGLLRALVG